MRRIAVILALCVLPGISNAASEESLRIYSDICYNVEGGDALGVRIGVMKLSNATYAFLQWSEGYPEEKPQMSEVSAPDLDHGKLVFSVPRGDELTTFRGTMTAKALTGTFSPKWPGDTKVFHLRRVPVQQKFFDCK
jgi:hypothetical protein